jgi:radial spoke head protein 4/6
MEPTNENGSEAAPGTDAFVDEATRFLMKEGPAGGPTLHDHLTQVLLKLIVERPANANSQFENISLSLRQLPASVLEQVAAEAKAAQIAAGENEVKDDGAVPPPPPKSASQVAKESITAWCASHKHLFPNPPPVEAEEGEDEEAEPEPEDPQLAGPIAPILHDAPLWKTAGVGFGDEQTFRLYRSLQILAGREGEECTIKFWGKILARNGAYFVAYANTDQTSAADPMEVFTSFIHMYICVLFAALLMCVVSISLFKKL